MPELEIDEFLEGETGLMAVYGAAFHGGHGYYFGRSPSEDTCPEFSHHHVVDNWETEARGVMGHVAQAISEKISLAGKLTELECRVKRLETKGIPAQITTLTPAPLKLRRNIPVVIDFNGEDYTASFFDANLHGSGETDQEAFDGLRDRIVLTFEILDQHDEKKLGPEPKRQLAVLRAIISRA